MALEAMDICLQVLKESSKSRFDSYSVLIVSRISFWDCRVHIFSDNLSRNSCIHLKVPVFTSSRSIVYIQVTDHVFSTLMNLEGNAIFRLGNLGTWRPFAIVKNLLPGFYHIFYGPWIQKEKKIGSLCLRIKRAMLINHFICCLRERSPFQMERL